jgi:tyrosyl-tRNA synthetase
MSKSRPESCIFIHDSPKKIKYKIQGAYCPQRKEENNPILEHARYIIFPWLGNLEIPRSSKFGGLLEIDNYESLRELYLKGKIHPLDLKNGVAKSLIKILKPVREYFKDHPDNLEKMKMIETTR